MRILKSYLVAMGLSLVFVLIGFLFLMATMQYLAQQAEKRFIRYGESTLQDLRDITESAGSPDKFLVLSVTMKNIRDRSLSEDSDYRIEKIVYLDSDLNTKAHSNIISLAESFQDEYQSDIYRIPNQGTFYTKQIEPYPFSEIYSVSRQRILEDLQDGLLTSWFGFLLRFLTPSEWNLDFMSIHKSIHISIVIDQSAQSVFNDRIHLFMTNIGVLRDLQDSASTYGTQLLTVGFWIVFILGFSVSMFRYGDGPWISGFPGFRSPQPNPAHHAGNPVVTNFFPGQQGQTGSPYAPSPPPPSSYPSPSWRRSRQRTHAPVAPQNAAYNPPPHMANVEQGNVANGMEAHPLPYTINYFSPPNPPPAPMYMPQMPMQTMQTMGQPQPLGTFPPGAEYAQNAARMPQAYQPHPQEVYIPNQMNPPPSAHPHPSGGFSKNTQGANTPKKNASDASATARMAGQPNGSTNRSSGIQANHQSFWNPEIYPPAFSRASHPPTANLPDLAQQKPAAKPEKSVSFQGVSIPRKPL